MAGLARITTDKIPDQLKHKPHWVLWKNETRGDRPTKVPYSVNGFMAKSNDPETWATFDEAVAAFNRGGYDGIGFMFLEGDGLCGIDLDGCRDPETGSIAPWAKAIIERLGTYAEVSPSQTGVKLFAVGNSPMSGGKKTNIPDAEPVGDKQPAIEIYDRLRYFAVTGWRVRGAAEPQPSDLQWLKDLYWPEKPIQVNGNGHAYDDVVERARRYVAKIPPAISGQGGHNQTFHVACVLVLEFGLSEGQAFGLLQEWNRACQPPWSDRDLLRKVREADKQPGERNRLRYARQEQWQSIDIPKRKDPEPPPQERKITTLDEAAKKYLAKVKSGEEVLYSVGIPAVDRAIGGGVALGEMVVVAALPSHGKSAIALQTIHHWTLQGIPCFFVSEEMTELTLGKRVLQFASDYPEEQWASDSDSVATELDHYAKSRAKCYVVESCATAEAAVNEIERHVKQCGIKLAVVDYTQQLKSKGNSKYEQVSASSIALKQCAVRNNIVIMALAQLNREIEKREKFFPKMSDIRDSAQIGQDADVIMFLCWPWKLNPKQDRHEYLFFVGKNRNREIKQATVRCKFFPARQTVVEQQPENYTAAFDEYSFS